MLNAASIPLRNFPRGFAVVPTQGISRIRWKRPRLACASGSSVRILFDSANFRRAFPATGSPRLHKRRRQCLLPGLRCSTVRKRESHPIGESAITNGGNATYHRPSFVSSFVFHGLPSCRACEVPPPIQAFSALRAFSKEAKRRAGWQARERSQPGR